MFFRQSIAIRLPPATWGKFQKLRTSLLILFKHFVVEGGRKR